MVRWPITVVAVCLLITQELYVSPLELRDSLIPVTDKANTSLSVELMPMVGSGDRDWDPVYNVFVLVNNSKPVENTDTVLLTCNASGSVQSRKWLKNSRDVQFNSRTLLSSDNVTLTIVNVNRNDSGKYQCRASNNFSSDSGHTILRINYGPENVSITPSGRIQVEVGKMLTLRCSAVSTPPAQYRWYNGSRLLNTGQVYNIDSLSRNNSGNYTCQAKNIITKESRNVTVQAIIQGQLTDSRELSDGVIVAIVISVLLSLGLISGISAWMITRKKDENEAQTQGQHERNVSQTANEYCNVLVENSAATYENIPRIKKDSDTNLPDGNPFYLELQP
ncbi:carcinoembryonic antigen-related cell adhesion molecule 5-like [Hemiscyllium ocellatum]|uniref:carcinoembryonic antigen-related cell adhesion molecule 5-like n=1 Tax=Hemiscyllium ocellatum TaxID=170820 RepID=UPI0029669D09|nr:carcinoembryonic antigen-related cell adhesion molecule 5-like [Hemiscyllium ocellatum]